MRLISQVLTRVTKIPGYARLFRIKYTLINHVNIIIVMLVFKFLEREILHGNFRYFVNVLFKIPSKHLRVH